jgi:hypothetical protein
MKARKLVATTAPLLLLGASGYAVAPPSTPAAAAPEVRALTVVGTRVLVREADGALASNEDLIGSLLVARSEGGIRNAYRIDSIEPDPKDPSGETLLYELSTKDPVTGAWTPACKPDAAGVAKGFPLEGVWTPGGEHVRAPGQFEITCTSGAIGKCVRMGYKPWKGAAMWDRHQACVRMVRADYCGDGTAHTRDGTLIDVFDDAGIQKDEPDPGMSFEAGWGKDGAVCVSHTRVPEVWTLAQARAACPARLGAACTEERAREDSRALLFNRSR